MIILSAPTPLANQELVKSTPGDFKFKARSQIGKSGMDIHICARFSVSGSTMDLGVVDHLISKAFQEVANPPRTWFIDFISHELCVQWISVRPPQTARSLDPASTFYTIKPFVSFAKDWTVHSLGLQLPQPIHRPYHIIPTSLANLTQPPIPPQLPQIPHSDVGVRRKVIQLPHRPRKKRRIYWKAFFSPDGLP